MTNVGCHCHHSFGIPQALGLKSQHLRLRNRMRWLVYITLASHGWNSCRCQKRSGVGKISSRAFRRRVSFGIGTLLVVEQSSSEKSPQGCVRYMHRRIRYNGASEREASAFFFSVFQREKMPLHNESYELPGCLLFNACPNRIERVYLKSQRKTSRALIGA